MRSMVPRIRMLSSADAENVKPIKAKLARASVRCIVLDMVILSDFGGLRAGASKHRRDDLSPARAPLQPRRCRNIPETSADEPSSFDLDSGILDQFAPTRGRKQEASDEDTEPLKHPKPPLPAEAAKFRQCGR